MRNSLKKIAAMFMVTAAPALMGIAAGDAAPDFTAKNQDGKTIKLSEQKGKYVLLYFYPKDETPGCTKEACSFRDSYAEIKKLNAVIFGVSRQDEKSHQKFIAKHKLPFDLLVDSDGSIGESFGVKTMPVIGFLKRQSILISPEGKVIKFYGDVDPTKHVAEVIGDLKAAEAKKG